MKRTDLLQRGYRGLEDFFFDLMVKSRGGIETPQDMFMELNKQGRRACLCYLIGKAREQDQDAFVAMEAIAIVI